MNVPLATSYSKSLLPAVPALSGSSKKPPLNCVCKCIDYYWCQIKGKTFLGLLYKDAEQNAFYLGLKFLEKVSPA